MFVEPTVSAEAVSLSDLDGTPPREMTVHHRTRRRVDGRRSSKPGSAVSRLVTIGVRTLRAEVMPVVALTALLTRWGEL